MHAPIFDNDPDFDPYAGLKPVTEPTTFEKVMVLGFVAIFATLSLLALVALFLRWTEA